MPLRSRLMGSENEYGAVPECLFTDEGRGRYFFILKAPFFGPCLEKIVFSSIFAHHLSWLENMGRLYSDTGSHPEYATPECSNSRDLVIWQKAGEWIMISCVEHANKLLWEILGDGAKSNEFALNPDEFLALKEYVKKKKIKPGAPLIRVYKNNIDFSGNSYGEHENHLFRKSVDLGKLYSVLLPHLVSRIIWQGAGMIYYDKERKSFAYRLSQRESQIGTMISGTTTTNMQRGLIHSGRDCEPHAENSWGRLHITGGDANMSEFVIRLKYVTTAILILMVENCFFNAKKVYPESIGNLDEQELLLLYRSTSLDPTLKGAVSLGNKHISAYDLQRILLGHALEFFAKGYGELDEDLKWGIKNWQKILDLISLDSPHNWLAMRFFTDLAAKKVLLESDMKRHAYHWGSPGELEIEIPRSNGSVEVMSVQERLRYFDLEYHRLHRQGIFYLMRMARQCTDREILYAMQNPPATRARVRKEASQKIFQGSGQEISEINWTYVKGSRMTEDGKGREYLSAYFLDPFTTKAVETLGEWPEYQLRG